MPPRKIDLNLLVILEALVAERSVSKVAQRRGLTQSAVSHALRRLRDAFNEPLFVRLPTGMEPTPRALEIAGATRLALEQLALTIDSSAAFDPATAQRSFTLRLSEYVSSHLLQSLCPALRAVAPGVRIQAMHFTGDPREDEIVNDEIHVRLAASGSAVGHRERLRVVDEKFVVLMRKTHPARRKKMTLASYALLSHVKVVGTIGTNIIDDALRLRGLQRDVVFSVPSWRDAIHIAANSDLVAAIPARWAKGREVLASQVVSVRFPLDDVTFAIDIEWHPRFGSDAGHAWFREFLTQQFRRSK
ncbi:MAG: LysR family transcriptional regulator [Bradyrhizobium sp.]